LQEEDVIILQTKDFSEIISDTTLLEFLDNPSIVESAENLAPIVHEKENPTAAAILIQYTLPIKNGLFAQSNKEDEEEENDEEEKEEVAKPEASETSSPETEPTSDAVYANQENTYTPYENKKSLNLFGFISPVVSFFAGFKNLNPKGLSRTRKIILLVVVLIVIVFASSIYFAVKKQDSQKITTEFNNIYPKAEKKFEEGQSLVDLNQSLAKDSFEEAKSILSQGAGKFPAGSSQGLQNS
jgi:uncharacterized protein HemX